MLDSTEAANQHAGRGADEPGTDADAAAVSSSEGLGEKLAWLMLFRLILVTFLLGSAVIVNVNDVDSVSDPSYVAILSLIVATYAATVAYAAWLRTRQALVPLAFAQLLGDAALTAGLVFLTGGVESIFSFLFFLGVFNGAILMGRRGAMFAASASALGLATIAAVQYAQVPWVAVTVPESMPRGARLPVYAMGVHFVGFFTVAALSGYLADRLGQIGTELAARQIDLRDLRALHETIVRSIGVGVVATDLDDRIAFANEEAEGSVGVELRDRVGRRVAEIAPDLWTLMNQVGTEPGSEVEQSLETSAGTRRLSIRVSSLRSPDGGSVGRLYVLRDVSELRELEQEVARQQHLASIGNLAASIAHEIRNPLAAISGSIEVLRMTQHSDPGEQELTDIVIREVDRLNGLIREFLDYAKPREIVPRLTQFAELIDHIVAIFQRDGEVADGVRFVIDHRIPPHTELMIDADRIQQVVWNLLRNAAEACRHGGQVLIKTRKADRFAGGGSAIVLMIEDNGPGLAPENIDRIFEPFFTTKHGGTGLGLATSHRIVAEHNGVLRAENLEGGGARFLVALPRGIEAGALSEMKFENTLPDRLSELHVPRNRSGGFPTV